MSQHDMVLADNPGIAFLSDVNAAIAAIVSQSSGATEPTTTYAFQWWADTSAGVLKRRNSANSAWVDCGPLDTALGALLQAQLYTAFTTGGISTAYTLTPAPALTALAAGQRFRAKINVTSGLNPTMAISGLTAKSLKVYDATGAKVAPATGSLVADMLVDLEYDGTDIVVLGVLPTGVVQLSGTQTIAGVKTFSSYPVLPTPTQKVLDTANGYGSAGGNKIRRFAVSQVDIGTDATLTDSASNGLTITINVAGTYAIGYTDNFGTSQTFGLSLNATPTTAFASLIAAQRLCVETTAFADASATAFCERYFAVNDVIRPHTQAATASGVSAALAMISVVRTG